MPTVKIKPTYMSELEKTQEIGELRTLPDYSSCDIDFVSNDYLGLGQIKLSIP